MKARVQERNLKMLTRSRDSVRFFLALSLVLNIILGFGLVSQSKEIIFVPPENNLQVWFKGSKVSRSYLETMGILFAHLLLDKSSKNARFQHLMLLKYIYPDSQGLVRAKLLNDEKRYKKENLSTSFYPRKIEVNADSKVVTMRGNLVTKVAEKVVTNEDKTFRLKFQNEHATWYLSNFQLDKEGKSV